MPSSPLRILVFFQVRILLLCNKCKRIHYNTAPQGCRYVGRPFGRGKQPISPILVCILQAAEVMSTIEEGWNFCLAGWIIVENGGLAIAIFIRIFLVQKRRNLNCFWRIEMKMQEFLQKNLQLVFFDLSSMEGSEFLREITMIFIVYGRFPSIYGRTPWFKGDVCRVWPKKVGMGGYFEVWSQVLNFV